MREAPVQAQRSSAAGVLMLVVCAALWSLNGPLIKLLKESGVEGVSIAFYRSALGGLVFIPFALRRVATIRRVHFGWPLGAVLLFTIMTVTFVVATTKTAAANAIVLQYTSPLWVFALSPLLLREKPGRSEGLALLVSMAGIAVIFFGHPTTELRWLTVALISGFGYGALTIALRGLRPVNPTVVACMNCLGSALLILAGLLTWTAFSPGGMAGTAEQAPAAGGVSFVARTLALEGRQFLLVLAMGLCQFALPYALFSWALQRVEAHRASLIVLLETILNPVFTWIAVREPVPAPTLIGGPLILLGVAGWLVLSWRHRRPPPQPPSDPAPEPASARPSGT